MQTSGRRVYVTDLDGTLLDGTAALTERTRTGLAELLDEGMLFTVASARSVKAMQVILEGLALPLPVIEHNGSYISDLATGRHLVTNALAPSVADGAYETIRAAGRTPMVSSFDGKSDRLHYSEIANPGVAWYVEDRRANRDPRLTLTPDLESSLSEQVICLTVIDNRGVLEEIRGALIERFGDAIWARIFTNEYFSDRDWLTVHDARATKEQALARLMEDAGLSGSEVVAFGDSDNDLSLLRFADRGIAVENASAELKALANEVIGPNTSDSVVQFLEREWQAQRAPSERCREKR
jgi:Cof subfamily protein (haloacid dehalogenase superfamily)